MVTVRKNVRVVEQVEVKNTHRVGASQWKKWSEQARYVFNRTFTTMLHNQNLFHHPKQKELPVEHWTTTAWTAADATNESKE